MRSIDTDSQCLPNTVLSFYIVLVENASEMAPLVSRAELPSVQHIFDTALLVGQC